MQTQQIISSTTGNFFLGTAGMASVEKFSGASFEKLFMASSEKYDMTSGNATKDIRSKAASNDEKEYLTVSGHSLTNKENVQTTKTVTETEQTDVTEDKELAERMAEIVAQVTQIVKDVLNLSADELKETMDLLGITEADLLNVDMLKQMVLAVNGEQDMTAFLTDSDLLAQMQQLTQEVGMVLADAGISAESMAGLLENAEFAKLFQDAMKEMDGMEKEADVTEELPEETAQNATIRETEITFDKETSEVKKDATGNGADRNTEGRNGFAKEDVSFANQFVQNLQNAMTDGIQETSFATSLAEQIREIANQILEQVKVIVAPEMTSLEIQLTPEHLGKLNITVTEQDGVMKATFVTDNELAKEAIESNLVQFKQMMNEQGIRVESVEVTVSEFMFDKNGETGQSSHEEKKQGKAHFVMEEENGTVSLQDELALHFMEGGESTVNYMA